MRVEFPSIINTEKHKFAYDSDRYDTASVSAHFEVITKRDYSDSWNFPMPIPTNLAGEYMISLATAMLENDELCNYVRYEFTSGPSLEAINFASKVVYKPGKKDKFYSKSLQRVSAVRTKQYDRRWEVIREGMDGTPDSIMSILTGDYSRDGITRYGYALAIRNWVFAERKRYRKYSMGSPALYLKWTDDYNEAHTIQTGWDAVLTALAIYDAKKNFKYLTDQYNQHNMIVTLAKE
jgi:hypothetical protein